MSPALGYPDRVDDDPVALAAALIGIESVNPSLDPSGSGEAAIAEFCAGWLAARGFEIERVGRTPARPSIIATRRGAGGGRTLLLNGHLDTVSLASPGQLDAVVSDGRLYGRGAYDTKGGVAALMVAASRAAGDLRGDLVVTLVADEEFGSHGTEDVLEHVNADAAIVTEPSGLELTLAHRGFAWFEVAIIGRAAHGSMPEQGIDAIAQAGRVMAALDGLRARLEARPRHPVLGHGTVRVATIRGGVDAATVADSCTLTVERRFLPGETPDAVEAELRAAIDFAPGEAAVTTTRLVARGAFEASPDSPIVEMVARHAVAVLGAAVTRGEPFWTDAALLADAGIPSLVIGVDGGGAHADQEWATTGSIQQLAEILQGTIAEFCS
ncbi:ArgE/DapE family deacylase [soil metagenome]